MSGSPSTNIDIQKKSEDHNEKCLVSCDVQDTKIEWSKRKSDSVEKDDKGKKKRNIFTIREQELSNYIKEFKCKVIHIAQTPCNKRIVHNKIHTAENSCPTVHNKVHIADNVHPSVQIHTVKETKPIILKRVHTAENACSTVYNKNHSAENPCPTVHNKFQIADNVHPSVQIHTAEKSCPTVHNKVHIADNAHPSVQIHTVKETKPIILKRVHTAENSNPTVHNKIHTEEKSCPTVHKKIHTAENSHPTVHSRIHTVKETKPLILKRVHTADNSHPTVHNKIHTAENSQPTEHNRIHIVKETKPIVLKKDSTVKKLYKCGVCQKIFVNKVEVIEHIRMHNAEKSKPTTLNNVRTAKNLYKCAVCQKGFTNKYNLVIHDKSHIVEKSYKCGMCLKIFSKRSELTTHNRIHNTENMFKCGVCLKSFISKSELFKHNEVHTAEILNKCGISQKSYVENSSVIHTKEKLYECDVCKEKFDNLSSLSTHKIIHNTDKSLNLDISESASIISKVSIRYKYCIVPFCKSTSIKTPNKIFFNVPHDPKLRLIWCHTVRREKFKKMFSNKSRLFVCEDHFNVPDDTVNHMHYKMMGGSLRLKKNILPHKFDCQKNVKRQRKNKKKYINELEESETIPITHVYNDDQWNSNTTQTESNDVETVNAKQSRKSVRKPYRCNLCIKSFKLKSELTAHTKIHVENKPLNTNSHSFRQTIKRRNKKRQPAKTFEVPVVENASTTTSNDVPLTTVEIKKEPEDCPLFNVDIDEHDIKKEVDSDEHTSLIKKSVYKYCAVPLCQNTATKTPDKIFFDLPSDLDTRMNWRRVMNNGELKKKSLCKRSSAHICEDHFNLEKDTVNYAQYKLTGETLILNKNIMPHVFECQKKEKTQPSCTRENESNVFEIPVIENTSDICIKKEPEEHIKDSHSFDTVVQNIKSDPDEYKEQET